MWKLASCAINFVKNQSVISEHEIIALSIRKIKTAEFLLANEFYDDAYYLGGYAVELFLKAKICKNLDISDFFNYNKSKTRRLLPEMAKKSNLENLYKTFKIHDLEQLIILSGLYTKLSINLHNDIQLRLDWSLVSEWSENSRYEYNINKTEVINFIKSTKNILIWVQKNL